MTDRAGKISRRTFLKASVKSSAAVAVSAAFPALGSGCSETESTYDIVIKNGTVYDGTGAPPVTCDVGIRGEKILAVGTITEPAGRIIDAKGLAVMPGFIDVHTHCDLTFIRSGWKRYLAGFMPSWRGNYNYLGQGVTTVVTGNCGWGFSDIEQWYGITRAVAFGTNIAHLAPHGVIREELFGADQPRQLTRAQMDRFAARLEEEMDKGAIGMSTGLEYAPGLLAPTEELIELAKIVSRYGRVYATHMRNESGALDRTTGLPGVVTAINEAVTVAREAEVAVEISHLKIDAPVNGFRAELVLDPIEQARDQGLRITADQYPYAAGSTILSVLLPDRFRSSGGVKSEFRTSGGQSGIQKEIETVFQNLPPDKILITMCPENENFEGKTLMEAAQLENKSPGETYAALVTGEVCPVGVFFGQDMNVVKGIMPRNFILTGSDGWTVPKGMTCPHPRTYGTFARKLGRFCRDEHQVDLLACIRSMTDLPAQTFHLQGRGRIKEGYFADICVIDLSHVQDRATYLSPHQYPSGVVHVLVNGTPSVSHGEFTGDRNGKNIRA